MREGIEVKQSEKIKKRKRKTVYHPGQRFNYWTLLFYKPELKRWYAECICGEKKLIWVAHLVSGDSISCSCVSKHTHGLSKSPTYKSWGGAKYRCTNPNNDKYANYGGRGIKMCDRWLNSFESFLEDMGERPEGKTLDRIDEEGDYSPENCRWVTSFAKKLMSGCSPEEVAKLEGMSYSLLQARLARGKTTEWVLPTPNSKE